MASKQYISIIRLFNHCGIPAGDDFNLSRAKKQLQAEFGIAQNGFIEVEGFTYTRHDVLEEIDRPDFTDRLKFHRQIWACKQILQLLEKNTANLNTIREEFGPFWGNEEFDKFFSPYFAGPFSYISRTLLADNKLKEMGALLAYEEFLQPEEREEAYRPVRIYLDENIRLLRNVTGENYNMLRPKIKQWIDTEWHIFFNNLPHEFYEEKNEVITKLINIGVAVQKTNKPDCRDVSSQLVSLTDTPESLRKIIVSNHAVYTGSGARSTGSSGSLSWRTILWLLWVVFMIIRLAGNGGCNSSRTNYRYEIPEIRTYEMNDSFFRTFDSSPVKIVPDTDVEDAVIPKEKSKRKR